MMPKAPALALCAAVVAVALTASCSGPGVAVATIQQVGLQALAADHVSAVLLLRGWLKIMYWRNIPGAGQCAQELHSGRLPGGGRHSWGTMSDCTTFDYNIAADGSGQGTMTFPDGGVEQVTWTAPVWVGQVHSVDIVKSLPDGTTLDFTNSADYSQPLVATSFVGAATLPDGRAMDFELYRRPLDEDLLRLVLPDGSALQVNVPLTSVEYALHWPVFNPGGAGSFTAAGGERLDFGISGAGDGWERWVFTTADGVTGEFNLTDGLAGNGSLTRNGAVVGALRWFEDGFGMLDLVDAGSAEITPSAAARDFQIDRWVANLAAMGPAPMY